MSRLVFRIENLSTDLPSLRSRRADGIRRPFETASKAHLFAPITKVKRINRLIAVQLCVPEQESNVILPHHCKKSS